MGALYQGLCEPALCSWVWHLIEVAESADPNSFQDHFDYCLFTHEQYKHLQQRKKKKSAKSTLATAAAKIQQS